MREKKKRKVLRGKKKKDLIEVRIFRFNDSLLNVNSSFVRRFKKKKKANLNVSCK